jgi:TolB-like protein/DNA-binding winged helix-turn-helix (wHTH) protein
VDAFRISAWQIEPQLNTVSRNGSVVRLEPKVMEVLVCLAEHAGEPVSRDKLLQTVWPATFVSDDVLTRSISELRRIFEDDARESRVIQTIPKRGYRLVARIETLDQRTATLPALEATRINGVGNRGFKILLSSVLVLSIGLVAVRAYKPKSAGQNDPPQIRSVAVLPLQNLSADPAQEYFSDGMTDALITDLAQIGSLKVISRTSTTQYKGTKKPLPEIARELNVDGIIEGTVQRSGDRVRITAQLIQVPADRHLWANSYERDMQDVFTLEREVTGDIARQIKTRLTEPTEVSIQSPAPINPKVLEAYLQGNYYLDREGKGAGDEERRKSAQYFQQAIDIDPDFAPAYNGLARAHLYLLWSSSRDVEIVKTAAQRAAELDPTLSDARVTLGSLMLCSWDFHAAEDEFRRALALNPSNANAHDLLSQLLYDTGRYDEGWREAEIAQELDPNADHLSFALENSRQYDRAIVWLLVMSKRDPDDGYIHHELFRSYAGKGMYKEAFQELEKAVSLFGLPQMAAHIHRAFAASGYRGGMRQFALELEHLAATKQAFMPVNVAEIYASLGNKDRAFYWLEEAYRQHDITAAAAGVGLEMINIDPMMDPLRFDPRFADLVRRVGLPQAKPIITSNAQATSSVQ